MLYYLPAARAIEMYEKLGDDWWSILMKQNSENLQVSATEYTFENGMILLDNRITYIDENLNVHEVKRLLLTFDYMEPPLLQIISHQEQKTYQQLLTKSYNKPSDCLFPNKDVSVCKVRIEFQNNKLHHRLHSTQYINLHTGHLIMESYEDTPNGGEYLDHLSRREVDLIARCGFDQLDILYDGSSDSTPIFAGFRDYKVGVFGGEKNYRPENPEHMQELIGLITREIDSITEKVHSVVREYDENYREKQKTIGVLS